MGIVRMGGWVGGGGGEGEEREGEEGGGRGLNLAKTCWSFLRSITLSKWYIFTKIIWFNLTQHK